MTSEGHLKIIDFGTAKYINSDKRIEEIIKKKRSHHDNLVEIDPTIARKYEHRSTFVGTAQYISPEMLDQMDCSGPADLWTLGNCKTDVTLYILLPYLRMYHLSNGFGDAAL